jgi:hypothetical protein
MRLIHRKTRRKAAGARKTGCQEAKLSQKVIVALRRELVHSAPVLDSLSISRHGGSSGELVFNDDSKPDGREQSPKEQSV